MNIIDYISIADIVTLGLIVVFALWGAKKGLMKSAVGLVSLGASVILAFLLKPVVSDLLNMSPLRNMAETAVIEKLSAGGVENITLMPDALKQATEAGYTALTEGIAVKLADFIIEILAFVSVLIVVRILVFFAAKLLKATSKLPIIGGIDKAAGMFVGVAKSIVLIYTVLAVIGAAASTAENSRLIQEIDKSKMTRYMYVTNPICKILVKDTGELK